MFTCRYLFPLVLLFLARTVCAQASSDQKSSVGILLGYAPRHTSYTISPDPGGFVTGRPVTHNGETRSTPGLYVSINGDSSRGYPSGWKMANTFYLDMLAYSEGANDAGYVFVLGVGIGKSIRYGSLFLSGGLGGYDIDPNNGVYAINGHERRRAMVTLGSRLMVGANLGDHLYIEAGTTYFLDTIIRPGVLMGIGWRL